MECKYDWVIHLVANGVVCEKCGKEEKSFIPNACNAHTHGMERYGHLDFQVVLNYPPSLIGYILNALGSRVRAGERFHKGEYLTGIFEDCPIRLDEFEEGGRQVLRAIVPDKNGLFPECEGCDPRYRLQLLKTEELWR